MWTDADCPWFMYCLVMKKMAESKKRSKNSRNENVPSRQKSTSKIIEIEEAQKRRKVKRAELIKEEKAQKRREKSLEKSSRPKMSAGKKFAVCGVIALAMLIFFSSGYRIIDLNLNKATYERIYEEKLAEKARLEKVLSMIDDPEFIGQLARDRFHMLKDGEILYVFPERESIEAQ